MQEKSTTLSAVLATGLLALFGTLGGSLVKGYWEKEVVDRELYSKLVMKALESKESEERLASLSLMAQVRLIKDEEVRAAIDAYVSENQHNPDNIPRILPFVQKSDEYGFVVRSRILDKVKRANENDLLVIAQAMGISPIIEPRTQIIKEINKSDMFMLGRYVEIIESVTNGRDE